MSRLNKGMLKSLEAVIAILMILTSFVVYFGGKESFPEFESISRELRGFTALKVLDENNKLRSDALANNTGSIQNNLKVLIPAEVNFQVFVCQTVCSKPSVQTEKMLSVTYLISGDLGDFKPRQVVLYMW